MTRALFAATAAIALLAGCNETAEVAPQNDSQAAASNDTQPATGVNPLGAPASGEQAAKLMHDRHEGMEEIGDAQKVLARELKGDSPDLAAVRTNAATIARLAPQVTGWFPPGTGPDVGKTRAKAEIWQKPEDFAAKTRDFQQAAQAFNAAVQGADVAAIKAAHADMGKSCKACHDLYRAPEKD